MATVVATLPVYNAGSLAITMPMLGFIQAIKFADSAMNLFDRNETSFTAILGDTGLSYKVKGTGFTYGSSGTTYKMTGGTISEVEVIDASGSWPLDYTISGLSVTVDTLGDFNSGWNLFVGDDQFTGSTGADHFFGWDGRDTIRGLAGDDGLHGDAGNDTLAGGKGNDTLYGGSGKDVFLFDTALDRLLNVDIIDDFNVKDDRIHLEKDIFLRLGKVGKLLTKAEFVVGPKATDPLDRIVYNKATGNLFYDPDGSKAQKQVLFAHIDPKLKLAFDDFLVV